MPFDLEDVLPQLDAPLFKTGPANAFQVDDVDTAVRCNCPVCSGALSIITVTPNDPMALNADERGETGPSGKPSLTIPEAAVQLNRTYASWNDFYIQPGVADVDNHWDDAYWGGAPSVVTFAFRSTAPNTGMPDDTAGFSRFNTMQINAAMLALQSWADVANVVFVRVGDGTSGESAYSNNATILFGNYSSGADGAGAFAYFPSQSPTGGDVWVNVSSSSNAAPQQGNYGMFTLVHEIGHAIGFSHPGEYNAGEGGPITYANSAEYEEDSQQYTVMSYFHEGFTGGDYGPAYAAAPQLDDIAAAQRTYGVNTTTRTGDTVYGFNSTADRPWFSAVTSSTVLIFAVWDAGGTDTFDFSGYTQTQRIDLRQGNFSNVGGLTGNVAVALGAVIENALGGSGVDTIIGNAAANRLQGNAGADTLTGGAGADIFVATVGGGADTITDFTVGSDLINIAAFGAYQSITQVASNTLVTIASGVTITLLNVVASTVTAASFITGANPPPAGYNLINGTAAGETLNGTAASDQIYGLGGDDVLNGANGADWLEGGADNDTLNGGAGDDVMKGGTGNDSYVVDATGDVVTELAGEGTDTVSTALTSYSLVAEVENLTGTFAGGQTLTGNSLNNVITGLGGADTLNGGDGDDTLNGGGGIDTMTGGAGNDSYTVENVADVVVEAAGGGTDTVFTSVNYTLGAEVENLTGTGGGLTLTGNALNNVIVASGVLNTLNGGLGADSMTGGLGNDTYVVDNLGDTVIEQAGGGLDTVQTNLASYTLAANVEYLTGTTGAGQSLTGNALGNVITAGAGADTLNGGAGDDEMIGGGGNDTYVIDSIGDLATEAAGGGTDTVQTTLASFTLGANLENLTGTLGAGQALTGNTANNVIIGAGGADTLTGGAGTDTLTGGGGADVFVVTTGGGADTVTDFVVGTDKIDVSAFGAYQTIVQSGADTLITVAAGVTIRLTGVTASTVTASSFIGLPSGPTVITGTTAANTLNGTTGDDHIFGLAGNDTLNGLGGADWLEGAEGLDKLYGGEGVDRLEGGDGNDTLDGGTGADTMIGGIGDDIYVVDVAGDVVTEAAGEGTDTVQTALASYTLGATLENLTGTAVGAQSLTGNTQANVITAAGGNDTLSGLYGDDRVYGGAGVDTIAGGLGADRLYGDEGADVVAGDAGADYLYGGADNDVLTGGADLDRLFGEDGDDTLAGDDGNDVIQGGAGADRITGGAGNDTLTGGDGADVYVATAGGGVDNVVDFQVGTDKIDLTAFGGYQTIAQNGSDTLITFATGVSMRLKGITASAITDASFVGLPVGPTYNVINGTSAGETLNGTAARDQIFGLGGIDSLSAGEGDDYLDGGDANDTLTGAGGADILIGGAGADVFVATVGGGADTVNDFVVGTDRIDVSAFGSVASVTQQGADTLVTVAAGVSFLLVGVTASTVTDASFIGLTPVGPNVINGTSVANVLTGTSGVDQINGLGGNDTLSGLGDNDVLDGGIGNDRLDGGTGADAMTGGAGNDTYVVDNAGDSTVELAAEGTDVVETSLAAYTLADNLENLTGTVGTGQTLTGNAVANTVNGGAGGDTLGGADGNDKLYGNDGADTLDGGAGLDFLYGGAGNDVLNGGFGTEGDRFFGEGGDDVMTGSYGADIMQGGDGVDRLDGKSGNDNYTGGAGEDVFVAGSGTDIVVDFEVGVDKIDLTAFGGYQSIVLSNGDTLITFVTGSAMRLKGIAPASITDASFIGLTSGYNLITGTGSGEALYGTAAADHISGLGGDDLLAGNAGEDLLEGGDGLDRLEGGFEADILTGGADADVFVATNGGGADVITDFAVGVDKIDVTLFGAYTSIVQQGLNTLVTVTPGITFLLQNVTASTVTASSFIGLSGGYNVINGSGTDNTLNGTTGADQINGFGGNDTLNGAEGDDLLDGGEGDDTLGGGTGADIMRGGEGSDVYIVNDADDVVEETGSSGIDQVTTGLAAYTIGATVERLFGFGDVHQTLTGNALANVIWASSIAGGTLSGLGGDDILNGNSAADTLTGGEGADTLFGGAGADVFVATVGGGADTINDFTVGTDLIDVSAFGSIVGVTQQGANALVTVTGGVTFLLLNTTAATVTDASFIGLVPVVPTWNEISGTAAADTINGTAAADRIQGLDALDRLFGLGGDDYLLGGAGNDVLVGGAGADLLEGGAGSDTFRYDSVADFNVGGALDRILDFATGDRINLSAIDADANTAGDQAFTLVGSFSNAAGQLTTSYNAGTNETLVQMDVNGDGVADYGLIVVGNPALAWVL